MGRGSKKLVRVVFCGNKSSCPDCPFMGNRTQIKLHLKMTHKITDTKIIINPKSGNICYICGFELSSREKIQRHILKMH